MAGQIIELTFLLIMAFLILSNADSFGTGARAVADVYTSAVRTLQGR